MSSAQSHGDGASDVGDGSRVNDSPDADSRSATSISNGIGAVISHGVDDETVSNKRNIDSIDGSLLIEGLEEVSSSSVFREVVKVSEISSVIVGGYAGNSVIRVIEVPVSSNSVGIDDVSVLVDVDSVGRVNGGEIVQLKPEFEIIVSLSFSSVGPSVEGARSKSLQEADGAIVSSSSSSGSGSTGSSVSSDVVDSNDSPSKSSHRAGNVSAVVGGKVNNNSSSNDGVDSRESEEIKRLLEVDGSSGHLPVTHISQMSSGQVVLGASMSGVGGSVSSVLQQSLQGFQ